MSNRWSDHFLKMLSFFILSSLFSVSSFFKHMFRIFLWDFYGYLYFFKSSFIHFLTKLLHKHLHFPNFWLTHELVSKCLQAKSASIISLFFKIVDYVSLGIRKFLQFQSFLLIIYSSPYQEFTSPPHTHTHWICVLIFTPIYL